MKKIIIVIICVLASNYMFSQSIIVNDPADPESAFTAEELIDEVLVNGNSCVNINLTNLFENPDGITDIAERSWGYFNDGGTSFPFEEGIILSTGFAVNSQGPNDVGGVSDGGLDWDGDLDIQTLLNNEYGDIRNTNNATVLEFTFVSSIAEVDFEFIFASEEYEDQWECDTQFRDGFAFLIKGPGIPNDSGAPFGGTNIASVTGSDNVPVTTASIHLDTFFCGFETPGVNFFPDLYVSNSDANNTNEIQFDGLTAELTTSTVTIIPNEEYTIKLVIADRGDRAFDSAVFLKAGSFDIGSVDLGEDITLGDPGAVCEGDITTLDAGANDDATFQWFKDGDIIQGETNQTLDISETGLYRVELNFAANPDCMIIDEVLIEFFALPEFDLGDDQLVCDNNATILDATVLNSNELNNISYQWFFDSVVIDGETSAILTVTENGIYTVEVTGNGCITSDSITVEIVEFNVDLGDTVSLCGEETFLIEPEITGSAALNTATYLWSTGETTPTITVTEDGTYTLDVTIDNCTISDDVTIIFRNQAIVTLVDDFFKCANETFTITAVIGLNDNTQYEYKWFRDGGEIAGETTNNIDVIEEGTYSVEVNDRGCVTSENVTITFYSNENCVISQGISPNGDGQNDNLDLLFLDDRSDIIKLSMFNRNGTLVYEEANYTDQWGGQTNDGLQLPVGNYFYVIELERESPITGWVYLNK